MSFAALCLLLGMAAGWFQQVPPADTTRQAPPDSVAVADTTQPAPDSLAAADTAPPPAAPPAALPAQLAPQQAVPQAAPDTQRAAPDSIPAPVADTLAQAAPDTVLVLDTGPSDVEALIEGVEHEIDRLQRGIGRQFEQFRSTFTLTRLVLLLLALFVTYVVVRLVTWFLERVALWRPAFAPRIRKLIPLVKFSLWIAAVWIVVVSLFAGSAVLLVLLALVLLGVAGYALFHLLRDLIGGMVLAFEQPFQLGSRVVVGDHAGEVQKIGLRTFQLVTADGSVAVIPNGHVLRHAMVSTAPDAVEQQVTVPLALPAGMDLGRAREIVHEATLASPYVYLPKPVTVALERAEADAHHTRVVVRAYVFDARYAQALANDVIRLAHAAFFEQAQEAQASPDKNTGAGG